MQSQASEARAGSRARCAIVHAEARGGAVPRDPRAAELAGAMERRGLDVVWCRDAYSAMSEMALHERLLRRGQTGEPMIVVLCDAERIPRGPALFDAAARLAPHAVIWRYDAAANPALAAYRPGAGASDKSAEPRPAPLRVESDGEPSGEVPLAWPLKVELPAQPNPPQAQPAATTSEGVRPGQLILTEEELAMLLGDDGAEESARARDKKR